MGQTPTYTHKGMIWHWIWKLREEAGFGKCVRGGMEIAFTWLPLDTLMLGLPSWECSSLWDSCAYEPVVRGSILWHPEAAVQAGIPKVLRGWQGLSFTQPGVLGVGTVHVLVMFSCLNWTGSTVFCALYVFLQQFQRGYSCSNQTWLSLLSQALGVLEIHPCFASDFPGNSSQLCFVFVSVFPGKAVAVTAEKSNEVLDWWLFFSLHNQFGHWEGDPCVSEGIGRWYFRNPKKAVSLLPLLISPFS